MHCESLVGHIALGIYILVICPAGRHMIVKFDTADLNQTVTPTRVRRLFPYQEQLRATFITRGSVNRPLLCESDDPRSAFAR